MLTEPLKNGPVSDSSGSSDLQTPRICEPTAENDIETVVRALQATGKRGGNVENCTVGHWTPVNGRKTEGKRLVSWSRTDPPFPRTQACAPVADASSDPRAR